MKRMWGMAAVLLLAIAPARAAAQVPTLSPACAGAHLPLDEAGYVAIGGIRQWVTIKGESCANPVVLIVHGGPGNPNTPYADAVFAGWTKEFTVVQWDQRGAGKTFAENSPSEEESLTIEQLTRDGVDLARHVIARLGKRKVILMGGSWGSALAVHMAKAEPRLFHAYIGTGQLVGPENTKSSYAQVLDRAKAAGDKETTASLEAIGTPPWTNPRHSGVLRRATRKYEALRTDPAPSEWWRPAAGYDTPEYEAAYEAGEDYSYIQFVGLNGDGISSRLDLHKLGGKFEIPVFLLQGEEDLVTTPDVAKAYFDSLDAPLKAFIRLPRTGHDPNRAMIAAQLEALKTRVRSRAVASDSR